MKPSAIRITSVLLLAGMLASCDDQTRTRGEGAGVGALLGAGLGAVIGNQSGNAGEGALIGALAGGLAGLAYGDSVARKKQNYINTEDYLDACIAQAVAVNQEAYEYNQSLESKIRRLEREISNAKSRGDDGELRAKRKEIIALSNECDNNINRVSSEIKDQKYALGQGAGASNAGQLSTQISKLESSRSRMEGNSDRLASLSNQVDV
jgi:hypothetical protein